ncbi:hypothetical protein GPECTOR_44g8 [Gonium pectorale]|uniref:Carboxypeptidase n=1 Tax=Gonium pectorale TaxID=33097 RepID=A0A150GA15_GONPE|nr:hypothetical protein GPECTOR_44g8 [Gonium pectorale]|eukprot:KXZ46405.1 hypothetical protein GPECTOR_44g8 [Gonium pectorale]
MAARESFAPLLLLLATVLSAAAVCRAARYGALVDVRQGHLESVSAIKPTYSGYLPVDPDGSAIYYAYYEAQQRGEDVGEPPIVLWLQGGPGCASTFGGFYELGPWSVTPDLSVVRNEGTWNRLFGLLLVDQPVGTGFSPATRGSASIPVDEMGMAAHLYAALQGFFTGHAGLAGRPLFITGESYAGKYVPSIAHYIFQAAEDATLDSTANRPTAGVAAEAPPPLLRKRALPPDTAPPLFRLAGVAIGNGLTDPRAQTQTLAAAAYYAGLLPPALRDEVAGRAAAVVALIDEGKWTEAHDTREELRRFITNVTGLGTMFDTRRTEEYDPTKSVDRFLNLPEVKEALRALPNITYVSCSDAVRAAMGADVMRSVKHLLPDILARIPVLLYQGQYDILDGVASVTSWLSNLEWPGAKEFGAAKGELWYLRHAGRLAGAGTAEASARGEGGRGRGRSDGDATTQVAGWVRSASRLTHAVVYRAGHMVPRDQPAAAQQLLEDWVARALDG